MKGFNSEKLKMCRLIQNAIEEFANKTGMYPENIDLLFNENNKSQVMEVFVRVDIYKEGDKWKQ
jgi:hypothetical protein